MIHRSNLSSTSPRPILTAKDMRACDEYTITVLGVPSQVLMERAAGAVADSLLRRGDLFPAGRVLVLCGNGNNGGDGFAAARFLHDGSRGSTREVSVLYTGRWNTINKTPDISAMSEECARQYRLLVDCSVPVLRPDEISGALETSVCVVDALLGIGLNSPVRGAILEVIEAVVRSSLPVLAVDIPTGVNADDGHIMGSALPAKATVTMQALKSGLLLYPGADLCGELIVADIGIDLSPAKKPYATLADEGCLAATLVPRARRSHKGTYGRVLAVCGSVGMSGAAVLCASGALRAGAGLVEILTPEENRLVLQISLPEAIVTPYDVGDTALGGADPTFVERRVALRKKIRDAVSRASVIVAGCGLGTAPVSRFVLRTVLESMPAERPIPLVLDADALNLLAEDDTLWGTPALSAPKRMVIITPHPAEMARLYTETWDNDRSLSTILDNTMDAAVTLAKRHGVAVVLKDAHTVIASPDGGRFICPFGNAGMATGGSGDVLAGVIASLCGQTRTRDMGMTAAAGVCLHALAGDAAACAVGEIGMLPSDLINHIPPIIQAFSNTVTRIDDI